MTRTIGAPHVAVRCALAAGCLLMVLAGAAAPAQAGEAEERAAIAYSCTTVSANIRARCNAENRAWSLAELRDTPAARIADSFTLLAPAAGIDPAIIRIVGMHEPEFAVVSFGRGVFVVPIALREERDRCLIEGSLAHGLARDWLGQRRSTTAPLFFDRAQEEAADAEGQAILERSGRPRWEVRYWLERAIYDLGDSGGRTDPETRDRLARLEPVPAGAEGACLEAPPAPGVDQLRD